MEARLKLVYCDRSGDENCRSRSQDQSVGGREGRGHHLALVEYDGAGRGRDRPTPLPSRSKGTDAPETEFGKAVRQVFAEAEPDEDGIVSISYGEVFERAVAKMLAAAEASTPF
jgi:uncharacterized OB-fold protein